MTPLQKHIHISRESCVFECGCTVYSCTGGVSLALVIPCCCSHLANESRDEFLDVIGARDIEHLELKHAGGSVTSGARSGAP